MYVGDILVRVGGQKNAMAPKEKNSSQEPHAGGTPIRIVLAVNACLPHTAYGHIRTT